MWSTMPASLPGWLECHSIAPKIDEVEYQGQPLKKLENQCPHLEYYSDPW